MDLNFTSVALTISIFVLVVFARRSSLARAGNPTGLPLPPGPPQLPVIGNALSFPSEYPWLSYASMAEKYGDVLHLNVFGQSIIVLNSATSVTDLLEKRSSKYSDRLHLTMMSDLMGWYWAFVLMPYGELWRRNRRAFHQHFMPTVISRYHPIQLREARRLVARLAKTPEDFLHHIRHTFLASIMSVAYGMEIKDHDDFTTVAEEAMEGLSAAAVPGAFIVDLIPILKYVPSWIPGATFKQKAQHWRPFTLEMVQRPWQVVKDAFQSGNPIPSIATEIMANMPEEEEAMKEEEMIGRDMLGTTLGAAADTTVSAVQTFFLAMAMYPEVQKKAQQELDIVIGSTRLPDFDDRKSLPYIEAMLSEIFRWQPVAPLAIAHSSSEHDEYRGYFIPKGSVIIGNAWAILRDPVEYPEPEEFRPERFLKDGKLNTNIRDPRTACFGFGRRICPGRYYSDHALFAVVTSVLHTYNITPALDTEGNAMPIRVEMLSGTVSFPKPFQCSIKPRSTNAMSLIQNIENDDPSV